MTPGKADLPTPGSSLFSLCILFAPLTLGLAAGTFMACWITCPGALSGGPSTWITAMPERNGTTRSGSRVNLLERAKAAQLTADLSKKAADKVAAALEASDAERESLLVDALALVVEAVDALVEILVDES